MDLLGSMKSRAVHRCANQQNAKTLAALGPDAFDLERFGTASPTVTIGGKTLKGSYAPLVASQLIFERPSGKEQWKLAAVSNKRIAVASPDGREGRRARGVRCPSARSP